MASLWSSYFLNGLPRQTLNISWCGIWNYLRPSQLWTNTEIIDFPRFYETKKRSILIGHGSSISSLKRHSVVRISSGESSKPEFRCFCSPAKKLNLFFLGWLLRCCNFLILLKIAFDLFSTRALFSGILKFIWVVVHFHVSTSPIKIFSMAFFPWVRKLTKLHYWYPPHSRKLTSYLGFSHFRSFI